MSQKRAKAPPARRPTSPGGPLPASHTRPLDLLSQGPGRTPHSPHLLLLSPPLSPPQVNYDDYGDDGATYGAANTATIKRSKSAAKAAVEAEEAALAAEEATLAEAGEGVEFVARPYDAAGDEELGGVAAFGPEFARRFAPVPADTACPTRIPRGHTFKFYTRLTRPNWYGIAAVAVYCVALLFYLYVRMAHTLDLGRYLPYGVFVFLVEICGATTTLLYGTNLVLDPVSEVPPPEDKSDIPGMVKVKYPYHIRVLVPCYSEPLAIVAKTLEAAQAAYLPYGVRCTVYLCDDGKDPKKRRWCMAPGRDIVYVSGRTRAPGEMNGKSANLNNCMRQIYPDGRPIPPTEVVCVFDADQVANPDFFLRMLWKFDAGDDVAMVLSPQVRRREMERGGDGERTRAHHFSTSLFFPPFFSGLLQPEPAVRHLQPLQHPFLGVRAARVRRHRLHLLHRHQLPHPVGGLPGRGLVTRVHADGRLCAGHGAEEAELALPVRGGVPGHR